MSVLPDSASLSSFFIVLAIFFILTTILVFNLGVAVTKSRQPRSIPSFIIKVVSPTKRYIYKYIKLLNPYSDYKIPQYNNHSWINIYVWRLLRTSTIALLRSYLLPEIFMPVDQWNFFQYRNNDFIGVTFHPWWGILNTIRGVFIPVWMGLTVGIVWYQMLLDFTGWISALGFEFILGGQSTDSMICLVGDVVWVFNKKEGLFREVIVSS